ncbi:MAG: hypothetical protein U5K43_05975 [Halofilum sp. (in: g-proteobacteria)]|nr:hypothetical protein [Halofilum sp. (in: g-proteobacteria)]
MPEPLKAADSSTALVGFSLYAQRKSPAPATSVQLPKLASSAGTVPSSSPRVAPLPTSTEVKSALKQHEIAVLVELRGAVDRELQTPPSLIPRR